MRKELWSVAVDRIIGLTKRFLYFDVRGGFDLEEYIAGSWGGYPRGAGDRIGKI